MLKKIKKLATLNINRENVSFSQAEGILPLPSQLKPGELSKALRNSIWNLVYESLKVGLHYDNLDDCYSPSPLWQNLFYSWHTDFLHEPADEFNQDAICWIKKIKELILNQPYNEVFDFLQFVMRHQNVPHEFPKAIRDSLKKHSAAYTVLEEHPTILPISSDEEISAIETAIKDIKSDEFAGARVHLTRSAEELTKGNFAGSVRESISAVESTCKILGGKPNAELEAALKALMKKKPIHPALQAGLSKLYAYTSSENGVRHALLENESAVDSADALFMYGACASFISYLIRKSKF